MASLGLYFCVPYMPSWHCAWHRETLWECKAYWTGLTTDSIWHVTGCIGLLAQWAQHPNIQLSIPASRALANLDVDGTPNIKFSSHLHLLYPTMRHFDLPKLDVVFIHGLLGGVFVTWRQRDREHTNVDISRMYVIVWLRNLFPLRLQCLAYHVRQVSSGWPTGTWHL